MVVNSNVNLYFYWAQCSKRHHLKVDLHFGWIILCTPSCISAKPSALRYFRSRYVPISDGDVKPFWC
jgi:hypothetical protein